MTFMDELSDDFQKMINFRKSVGYATATYESSVPPFIHFCSNNYVDATCITQEMVDAWLNYYPYKTARTQAVFISLLRQYTKFINSLGKNAFIPDDDYTIHSDRYLPYIFTDEELQILFQTIDTISPSRKKIYKREIVLPVLFRMMYCCGMRPSEPLHLRMDDIDLDTGDIYIRQTKKNKDRHIIMSEDMRQLCIKYSIFTGERSWFFERWDGEPFQTKWMTRQFHICWDKSELVKHGNPRPYDFRHCFGTRNMMRWIDEGKDVMSLLPYLSTYMGHSEFRDTLYYVHLLPERLRKSAGIDWSQFDTIYGEAETDEED